MRGHILIVGCGALGRRYFEGIVQAFPTLRFSMVDPFDEARASVQRLFEQYGARKDSQVLAQIEQVSGDVDIAIVATTADVRARVVSAIVSHLVVKYWVLEKVLTQSWADFEAIENAVAASNGAWVSHTRRQMPWRQLLKEEVAALGKPLCLEVHASNWGLACNAAHYIDEFAWWSGENCLSVDTLGLDESWTESKRSRFFEVFGSLEVEFSGDCQLTLNASTENGPIRLSVRGPLGAIDIGDTEGTATHSDGRSLDGRLLYMSETSVLVVRDLLQGGTCDLPTLSETRTPHRYFLDAMLKHWNESGDAAATEYLPIT